MDTYTYFIPTQYVVQGDQSYFAYGEPREDFPFTAQAYVAPPGFVRDDWRDYNLPFTLPHADANLLTKLTRFVLDAKYENETFAFRDPLGGQPPTTLQITAASSASTSFLSPSVPAGLAQFQSLLDYEVQFGQFADLSQFFKDIIRQEVTGLFEYIYQRPIFQGMSLCTQWPEPCGLTDGQFIDGGFADTFP